GPAGALRWRRAPAAGAKRGRTGTCGSISGRAGTAAAPTPSRLPPAARRASPHRAPWSTPRPIRARQCRRAGRVAASVPSLFAAKPTLSGDVVQPAELVLGQVHPGRGALRVLRPRPWLHIEFQYLT